MLKGDFNYFPNKLKFERKMICNALLQCSFRFRNMNVNFFHRGVTDRLHERFWTFHDHLRTFYDQKSPETVTNVGRSGTLRIRWSRAVRDVVRLETLAKSRSRSRFKIERNSVCIQHACYLNSGLVWPRIIYSNFYANIALLRKCNEFCQFSTKEILGINAYIQMKSCLKPKVL